ncbi:MAG: DoxX family protein [Anaerolineaceae bacterium]|nr:DoxX family protein [Anaerolineaceae bacterium]
MNTEVTNTTFNDPPIARALFSNTRWSWLWLILRGYLGYTWLNSGIRKVNNPAWVKTGEALKGFWERAVLIPDPPARPAIAFDWYRGFLQSLLDSGSYTWFAKLVVAGELLIGIALVLGLFTGIAAFFGGFMNWNFMMAGSASTNPLLFIIAIFLILAWKVAGWWGLDRWVLPALGTPWQPGKLFRK